MDHDAGSSSGMKLIPTVFMLRQPPKSIEDPILRGQVGGGGLDILPPSCHKGLDLDQCHSYLTSSNLCYVGGRWPQEHRHPEIYGHEVPCGVAQAPEAAGEAR